MGKWVYIPDESDEEEDTLNRVYFKELETIIDPIFLGDGEEDFDPETCDNEDEFVARGIDFP